LKLSDLQSRVLEFDLEDARYVSREREVDRCSGRQFALEVVAVNVELLGDITRDADGHALSNVNLGSLDPTDDLTARDGDVDERGRR
jgi:hypothetical protein